MTAVTSKTVKSAIFYSALGIAVVAGVVFFIVDNQTLGKIFLPTADDEGSGGSDNLGGSVPNLGYLIRHDAIMAVGEEASFGAHSKFGKPPFSFEWKFSDGVTLNGQNVTRSFDSPGRYFFTLTLTDGTGDKVTSKQLNTNVVQELSENDASANRTSVHQN